MGKKTVMTQMRCRRRLMVGRIDSSRFLERNAQVLTKLSANNFSYYLLPVYIGP